MKLNREEPGVWELNGTERGWRTAVGGTGGRLLTTPVQTWNDDDINNIEISLELIKLEVLTVATQWQHWNIGRQSIKADFPFTKLD